MSPEIASFAEHVHSHDGVEFDTPESSAVVRAPSDLIHFVAGVVIGGVGILGMVRLFASFDRFVTEPATAPDESQTIVLVMAFAYAVGIVLPAAIAVIAATRWAWSRLAVQLGGMVLAWLSVSALMDAVSSGSNAAGMLAEGSLGLEFVQPFAAAVSAIVFVGPVIARQWGTAAWVLLGIGAVIAMVVSPGTTSGMVTASGVGLAIGAGFLLVAGTPSRHPSAADLASAMRRSGVQPRRIRVPNVDARGSSPYMVTTEDGSELFVKVVTVDERSSDLMFRMIRGIALKNAGDEPEFSSLRRTVEHEAFLSMAAERAGVRTPRIRAGGTIGSAPYSVFLGFEAVEGSSLDGVEDDRLTDAVLEELWNQVATLRSGRIAHRDLRLANVMLDSGELPWIIDFGFSELAPADAVIDTDIAELIASTSIKVGPERAIGAAVSVLGSEPVCAAAARMQPPLLSGATRAALRADPELRHAITVALESACGGGRIEYDSVQRFRPFLEQK